MLQSCCCCCTCCCCCFDWLLGIVDKLIQYFNVYAFTEVAVYGKNYVEAAKATWALIKSNGVDAILNDVLVGGVLTLGKLIISLLSGVFTALIAYISGMDDPSFAVAIGLISFLFTFFIFGIVSQVIQAGVVTLFVCICEDVEAIKCTKPELYEKIISTYPSSRFK